MAKVQAMQIGRNPAKRNVWGPSLLRNNWNGWKQSSRDSSTWWEPKGMFEILPIPDFVAVSYPLADSLFGKVQECTCDGQNFCLMARSHCTRWEGNRYREWDWHNKRQWVQSSPVSGPGAVWTVLHNIVTHFPDPVPRTTPSPGVECQSDPPWNLGTSPDTRGTGLLIFRAFLNTWALR